jgi:drug/metabolite transporter (DMT)-like permease
MKIGMEGLSSYQVASLRLVFAAICLLPFFFKYIRQTPAKKIPLIILSGLLGNGIPAYLFCIAETEIDSSLAGILNALTPLMVLLSGAVLFASPIKKQQMIGVGLGLLGVVCLFAAKGINTNSHWQYGMLVVLATICYGVNISMVHHHLKGFSSLHLGSIALFFSGLFSLPVLFFTNFFSRFSGPHAPWLSLGASMVLGVMGTAVAAVLFYMLIKRAGSIFASMVAYALPVVAVGWGLLAGEVITWLQVGCMGIILLGVYLANRKS